MKRFLVILFVLFPLLAFADDGERILRFSSEIAVEASGDLKVTETIEVVCAGERIKHGIYRDFPTRYAGLFGSAVAVAFEVREVLKDGKREPWRTASIENGVRVYIGDEDVTLKPATYTYVLTYRTDRQLGFFDAHDELYWNVTGNGWEFPIERTIATVALPDGAVAISAEAYTGHAGARGTDYASWRDANGRVVFATTRPLEPREGLTIVVAWPKGFVHEPTREEKAGYFLADNRSTVAGLAGILIVLGYYLLTWRRIGRDPEAGVIVPLYDAPEGFSPAAVRYVMRMGFDGKAFAASILNLAVRGWLSIDEDKHGLYTLTRKGTDGSALSTSEARMARQLFKSRASLALKPENHSVIAEAMDGLRKNLAVEYEKLYFLLNKGALVPGLVISVLALAAIVILGRDPIPGAFMSVWLSGWTAGCTLLVVTSFKAWRTARGRPSLKRLVGYGQALIMTVVALPFLAGECLGLWFFSQATSIPAVACVLVIVLLNILFYHLMKAPTIRGRQVMDAIEGLKLYLSVAEEDRFGELHPPEKTPEIFERMLPYALALDVENTWCEQFADVLERTQAGTKYSPAWYTGVLFTAGTAAGVAAGLGAMSSSISSASSPPGSSSGSGGGGSSGGGGGGGGGGGW